MAEIGYNPFGNQGVILKFPCENCGYWIKTDEIAIPYPDYLAETARDSYNYNNSDAICPKCKERFKITVWASYVGGYIEIQEIVSHSEVEIEEIPSPFEELYDDEYETSYENKKVFKNFQNEVDNLIKLNEFEVSNIEVNRILKRQIFIGVISAVEAFLFDTLIKLTLANEEYFKNFIETHPEFKKRKLELCEIFKFQKNLNKIAKDVMFDMLYHDLRKIRQMYMSTFQIEFPEIKQMLNEVTIRHDLVHRNGKTKEGKIIEIAGDDVIRVIDTAKSFTDKIAKELNLKEIELPDFSL